MVDVLIVNPPSPDGHIYIRDICRWGRKSREKMIWPQTSLAYLAAMVGAIFLARETALEEERAGKDVTAPDQVGRPQSGRQLV